MIWRTKAESVPYKLLSWRTQDEADIRAVFEDLLQSDRFLNWSVDRMAPASNTLVEVYCRSV